MKKAKTILSIVIILLISFSVNAQQDPMFTHYMYNTLSVNPAYAGSRDALTATILHRSQWVGFEGAPITQNFNIHSPIRRENIGLGFSIINDKIGPLNSTNTYIDFAYRIKTGAKSDISFGLKGGANMVSADLNNMNLDQQNDGSFINSNSILLPNFGFGMYYRRKQFYAGISTPKLLENKYSQRNNSNNVILKEERRHFFLISGALFNISDVVEFKPTTFVKVTPGAPIEADITGTFIFEKIFSVGAMLRTGDAIGILTGYNLTNQLYFGYAFDWSYGLQTILHHVGSHEIMLRYDFLFNDKQKIKSPRYF